MKKIPKSLNNIPVVDAIIEVRFTAEVDANAVFGLIYSKIQNLFPGTIQSLPVSQMPMALVENDVNLKFRPHFRIDGENCALQIGPHMISIVSTIPYIGWEKMYSTFSDIVDESISLLGKINRLGLRYVNFFDGDVSDKVNIQFNIADNDCKDYLIQAELEKSGLSCRLQYTANATYNRPNGENATGTVLDIDTSKVFTDSCTKEDVLEVLEKAHVEEKKLFFSILKDDFINSLDPDF